jgi:hypothetical protein
MTTTIHDEQAGPRLLMAMELGPTGMETGVHEWSGSGDAPTDGTRGCLATGG